MALLPLPRFLKSKGKSSSSPPPYPGVIKVKHRSEREELKYWKKRAQRFEKKVGRLEDEKISSLEGADADHGGVRRRMRRESSSSPDQSFTSSESSLLSSESPSTSATAGRTTGNALQRKDQIVRQLVSEMERLLKVQQTTTASSDSSDTDSASDIIETSALEDIVSRALSADQDHRDRHTLYQLSCKCCIGQNFVGSTKHDLRHKAREHYAAIWKVVQTAYGDSSNDENVSSSSSRSFRGSSFSHHIAGHCQECSSEEEVFRWCAKNVKVEKFSKHPLNRSDSALLHVW